VASSLQLTVGGDVPFRAVSTRVLLRTGVNLRDPRPDQVRDRAAIDKVVKALADMGMAL